MVTNTQYDFSSTHIDLYNTYCQINVYSISQSRDMATGMPQKKPGSRVKILIITKAIGNTCDVTTEGGSAS